MKSLSLHTLEAPSVELPREATGPGAGAAPEGGFEGVLEGALRGVEEAQLDADREATQAALGGGNLHEMALSLEKADVAMRAATKVRNKIVDAYHELMRTSL